MDPDGTQYGFATKLRMSPVITRAAAKWNHVLPVMRRQVGFRAGVAASAGAVAGVAVAVARSPGASAGSPVVSPVSLVSVTPSRYRCAGAMLFAPSPRIRAPSYPRALAGLSRPSSGRDRRAISAANRA